MMNDLKNENIFLRRVRIFHSIYSHLTNTQATLRFNFLLKRYSVAMINDPIIYIDSKEKPMHYVACSLIANRKIQFLRHYKFPPFVTGPGVHDLGSRRQIRSSDQHGDRTCSFLWTAHD